MKTSDFYYELPQELIAQDPLEDRSSSAASRPADRGDFPWNISGYSNVSKTGRLSGHQ